MPEPPMLAGRLARLRVPLGFALCPFVVWLAAPTPTTVLIGAPIAAAGEAFRLWAAGHVFKAREVTTSGPYRWFAHPLYVGSSVIGVGLAIGCASLVVALLIAVYLIVTLTAAVKNEEAFLRLKFGDRYERYRRGDVARGSDGRRRFSLAQAMRNREHRAVVGLALALLLLTLKASYNGSIWRTAGTRIVRPGG